MLVFVPWEAMHLVLITCIIVNNSAGLIDVRRVTFKRVTVRCVCKTEKGLKRRGL